MSAIQPYDALMLAVLALATLLGALKGMAWQVASLLSVGLSYLVALRFAGVAAPYFGDQEPINRFLAMLALYVGTSMGVWLAFRLVASAIDRVRLKDFDRQLGALFGATKGVLICVAITFFAVTLSTTGRQYVLDSRSGHYIAQLIERSEPLMPDELRDVVGPYLNRLDAELSQPDSFAEPGTANAESYSPWDRLPNR